MNYQISQTILKEIDKSQKILISVHRNPDPDGIGSGLCLYEVLKSKGKEIKVICPSSIAKDHKFLPFSEIIEKIDYRSFSFKDWDLLISLDASNFDMVTGDKEIPISQIPIVSIDHHVTNKKFGKINLLDDNLSSACELLYLVLSDWEISLTKTMAQNILAGIICDTGVFEYSNVTPKTLEISQKLMEKGADKDEIVLNIYRSIPFKQLKFWGEILKRMEIDEEYRFVWSSVPYDIYKDYGNLITAKETASSMFSPIVTDTDFGMIMVEQQKGILSVSFRSRKDFDVSQIAKALGGGGHRVAAGAKIKGLEFEKATLKVLEVSRKYANKKNTKEN